MLDATRRHLIQVTVLFTALLVTVLAQPHSSDAADWPQWRGPNRNGISNETGWRCKWPQQGPPILWEKPIGTGFASMAVRNGCVYAMGNTGRKGDGKKSEHRDVVHCLDAGTGDEIWKHSYLSPLDCNDYEGGPSATPTVHDGRVYTVSKHGKVFCLDAQKGRVVWNKDLAREFGIQPPRWGLAGSAVVVGDMVVFNAGTHGIALNRTDGGLVWQNGKGTAGYGTPVLYDLGGEKCLAILGHRTLAGVAGKTGQLLWQEPWTTMHDENIPDPIVLGDKLFVCTGLGTGCALLRIDGDRLIELWRHKDMQNWLSTSVLWKGHLYGIDARSRSLRCLDFETGQVKWSQGGFGLGSVMMANGKLIALTDKGKLVIARASPDHYEELSTAQILTGKCWTVPVLANGRIYARNADGRLVCVDVRNRG